MQLTNRRYRPKIQKASRCIITFSPVGRLVVALFDSRFLQQTNSFQIGISMTQTQLCSRITSLRIIIYHLDIFERPQYTPEKNFKNRQIIITLVKFSHQLCHDDSTMTLSSTTTLINNILYYILILAYIIQTMFMRML